MAIPEVVVLVAMGHHAIVLALPIAQTLLIIQVEVVLAHLVVQVALLIVKILHTIQVEDAPVLLVVPAAPLTVRTHRTTLGDVPVHHAVQTAPDNVRQLVQKHVLITVLELAETAAQVVVAMDVKIHARGAVADNVEYPVVVHALGNVLPDALHNVLISQREAAEVAVLVHAV